MIFKTRRFGAFIHFGLYSQNGWHEQDQLRRNIPKSEYVKLQQTFNPYLFDAEKWVLTLKNAGAEYICFTTKHHDGFCMWDTQYTDYKITNTPFGRDLLKELSMACQKYDMALELYYSCPDWHHPNSINIGEEKHQLPQPNEGDEPNEELYKQYVKNQMTELLTNYGKIHAIFWDIPPKRKDESVNELVRKLQPHILINDRGYSHGDYSTPERDACIKNANFDTLCEACQSVGMQSWGYRGNEDYFTPSFLISSISSILTKGGNYLLNIGPKADGTLPTQAVDIFSKCGSWYKRIRESIIDTKFVKIGDYNYTYKDNSLYLHLPANFGCTGVVLAPISCQPKKSTLLNTDNIMQCNVEYTPVNYNITSRPAYLRICDIPANELIYENIVVKLEFENLSQVLTNVTAKIAEIIL